MGILNKKILVIGSGGMLGQALVSKLSGQCELTQAAWPDASEGQELLDITKQTEVDKFIKKCQPNVVFNCAAYTDVDGAEDNENSAFSVNGIGAGILAHSCKDNNSLLVHISTDYVFDGDGVGPYEVDDDTKPIGAYGRGKLAGEELIKKSGCDFIIVRTSWLFGAGGKNFVDTIIRLAGEKKQIKVVDDQVGCPTYTVDLAGCMVDLAEKDRRGIYHFCNGPACSWFDFACEIIKLAGLDCEVVPCTTNEYPTKAKRPGYSVLDASKTAEAIGQIRSWQQCLEDFIKEKGV